MRIDYSHMGHYCLQPTPVDSIYQLYQPEHYRQLNRQWITAMTTDVTDLIQGYSDWIVQEYWNDRVPYYISIMFHPLHGSANYIMSQMQDAIYDHFYPTLCKRLLNTLVEKAKNTSCHALCFFMICQSVSGSEQRH
jgi:hypothetical protein